MYLTDTMPPPAISDVSQLKRKHEEDQSNQTQKKFIDSNMRQIDKPTQNTTYQGATRPPNKPRFDEKQRAYYTYKPNPNNQWANRLGRNQQPNTYPRKDGNQTRQYNQFNRPNNFGRNPSNTQNSMGHQQFRQRQTDNPQRQQRSDFNQDQRMRNLSMGHQQYQNNDRGRQQTRTYHWLS